MMTLFFEESHDRIRQACSDSLADILDNCFKDGKYGKEGKSAAKELIYGPLFDVLAEKDQRKKAGRVYRQSICAVVKKLNSAYMKNPPKNYQVVDASHGLTMA